MFFYSFDLPQKKKTKWTEKKHYKIRHWRSIHLFCFVLSCGNQHKLTMCAIYNWKPGPSSIQQHRKRERERENEKIKQIQANFNFNFVLHIYDCFRTFVPPNVYSRFTLIWSTIDFQINVLIQCSFFLSVLVCVFHSLFLLISLLFHYMNQP